jgi:membrane protein YqaA with SNARE-associated domain
VSDARDGAPAAAPTSELSAAVQQASVRVRSRLRAAVLLAEIGLALTLIVWWLSVGHHGHMNGLLVLLLYCFPSEFLIAPAPHEPVLIYFGKVYAPWLVALVSGLGTLVVEAVNYSAFGSIADARPLRRVVRSTLMSRLLALFSRQPFLALLVGGLAPLPFYPFRFLVVLARYPRWRYLTAVAIARFPRFYLIALFGATTRPPDWVFAAIVLIFVCIGILPLVPWSRIRPRPGTAPGASANVNE